jgi:hypothetical protein
LLRFGSLPHEEFFAPHLEVVLETGEFLWPFSRNQSLARAADAAHRGIEGANTTHTIVEVENPFFAAYPAWNSLGGWM